MEAGGWRLEAGGLLSASGKIQKKDFDFYEP